MGSKEELLPAHIHSRVLQTLELEESEPILYEMMTGEIYWSGGNRNGRERTDVGNSKK